MKKILLLGLVFMALTACVEKKIVIANYRLDIWGYRYSCWDNHTHYFIEPPLIEVSGNLVRIEAPESYVLSKSLFPLDFYIKIPPALVVMDAQCSPVLSYGTYTLEIKK